MTLEDALAKLRAAKPLLDRYGVQRVGVFGSTARGEARPDSDVDVLVEFTPATLPGFGFFRLERDLAALFGRPVDLITPDGLHDLIQERVLGEAVFALSGGQPLSVEDARCDRAHPSLHAEHGPDGVPGRR